MRAIVVGVGDFGVIHAGVVATSHDFELVALVDADGERAGSVGAEFGVPYYTSLSECLDRQPVDVAVVATPERLHPTHVDECLAGGLHVLVEKPVALDSGAVERMAAAASRAGRQVMPAHILRFLPEVHHLLANTSRIRSVTATRYVPRARRALHARVHPAWMAMIHDVDLVAALLDRHTPLTVRAFERRDDPDDGQPDLCWALIEAPDGPLAFIENHWLLPNEHRYVDSRLSVTTVDEVITLRLPSNALVRQTEHGDEIPSLSLHSEMGSRSTGALAVQLEHFADVVIRGARPLVSLQDAIRDTTIVEAVVASARRGGEPVAVRPVE